MHPYVVVVHNVLSGIHAFIYLKFVTPCVTVKIFGGRLFSCADPSVWNRLPQILRHNDSASSFNTALKIHLFLCGKFGLPFLGKATAATRSQQSSNTSVCDVFVFTWAMLQQPQDYRNQVIPVSVPCLYLPGQGFSSHKITAVK